jgi:glucose/arabinose dehydrogenase
MAGNETPPASGPGHEGGLLKRHWKWLAGASFLALVLYAWFKPRTWSTDEYRIRHSIVVDAQDPRAVTALPDGSLLYTEQGAILKRANPATGSSALIDGLPDPYDGGPIAIYDLAVGGTRDEAITVYSSFLRLSPGAPVVALARMVLTGSSIDSLETLFEASGYGVDHFGNRITVSETGDILMTVGPPPPSLGTSVAARAALDATNHHGSVIRLRPDGSIPEDNPFADGEAGLPEIWLYGFQNPGPIAARNEPCGIWVADNRPDQRFVLARRDESEEPGSCVDLIGNQRIGGLLTEPVEDTIWNTRGPRLTVISALATYSGSHFAAWQDDLLIASSGLGTLRRFVLTEGQIEAEEILIEGLGRIYDLDIDAAGHVYLALDNYIVRLERVD